MSGRVLDWLVAKWQWPYAALFTAGFLTVLAPFVFRYAGLPLGLIYLQLPIYTTVKASYLLGLTPFFAIFFALATARLQATLPGRLLTNGYLGAWTALTIAAYWIV